jgi:drug/metabolite transporter (DMT)-like permease
LIVPALMAICILAGAAGDVSVTRGMKQVGEIGSFHPADLIATAGLILRSASICFGIFCKAVAFFSFLALLSRADLSWAAPAVASTYLVDILAAKYVLGEKVTRMRWTGAIFVCAGVAMISL